MVSETCEFLLIAATVSSETGERFSGRQKYMLLLLYKTVIVPNSVYCVAVWSAVFEKGNLKWE